MKGFSLGFVAALAILAGGTGGCLALGLAPAAAGDPPLPLEKTVTQMALRARISKEPPGTMMISPNEPNLLSGAKIYVERCASCHGLPGQAPPEIGARMYPPATPLFKGKGVTDDPVVEDYWKVANGIRLTGMPAFKSILNDQQVWQVSQLIMHADQLPDSVKRLLR
jgi:thiosulfate dehydrogenase